jgi:hypothetical protein
MILESGLGNGKLAGIDNDNRLLTASFNIPFAHLIAKDYNKSFSVIGTCAPVNGEAVPLHIENLNATDVVVITRVSLQIITNGSLPSVGEYFTLEVDSDYTSGGNIALPVNASAGASTQSGVRATQDNPTVSSGGVVEAFYPSASSSGTVIEIEGSALILPGRGACVRYTGTGTAGVVKAAVGFVVVSQSGEGYSG